MTAKEYLKQIHTLDIVIHQKQREANDLREIATAIGSLDYSKDRVQVSPSREAPFAKTAERAAQLDAEIRRLTDERLEIVASIQKLGENRFIEVLYKRYVEYKKFDEIAGEMGYSLSSIYRLHNNALEALGNEL